MKQIEQPCYVYRKGGSLPLYRNALTPDVSAGRFLLVIEDSETGEADLIQNASEILGVELSDQNAALLDVLGIVHPEQAARLLATSDKEPPPQEWTPETVKRRLIESAELIERTTRAAGPSQRITCWVDWQLFRGVTDFERNAMAEGFKEGTRAPDRGIYRGAGAREIAEAETAMEWPARYISDEAARRTLAFWIFCDLKGAPFGRLAPKMGVSKGTAYRLLARALARIVTGLTNDCIPTR